MFVYVSICVRKRSHDTGEIPSEGQSFYKKKRKIFLLFINFHWKNFKIKPIFKYKLAIESVHPYCF